MRDVLRPHRLEGPAIERTDGSKDWLVYGVRHREDGPATEDDDLSWFVCGTRLVCCDRSDDFGSSLKLGLGEFRLVRTMSRMIEEYWARR